MPSRLRTQSTFCDHTPSQVINLSCPKKDSDHCFPCINVWNMSNIRGHLIFTKWCMSCYLGLSNLWEHQMGHMMTYSESYISRIFPKWGMHDAWGILYLKCLSHGTYHAMYQAYQMVYTKCLRTPIAQVFIKLDMTWHVMIMVPLALIKWDMSWFSEIAIPQIEIRPIFPSPCASRYPPLSIKFPWLDSDSQKTPHTSP